MFSVRRYKPFPEWRRCPPDFVPRRVRPDAERDRDWTSDGSNWEFGQPRRTSQDQPMGSITIQNGFDVEEHASTALDGRIEIDLDDPDHVRFVVAANGAVDETMVERAGLVVSDGPPTLDAWWLLAAPLAAALALVPVALLAPGALQTGTTPAGLLAFALLVPFFLLCVAGTVLLYRDATALGAVGAEWTPNPWRYLVPGALALTFARSYPVVQASGSGDELGGFVAGTFVVALVASSLLAGPVYLYDRHRHLGLP